MTDAHPDLETMIDALPAKMQPRLRARMSGMTDEQRSRMRQRVQAMYAQMDPHTREEMAKHVAHVDEVQVNAPDVGAEAFDFDLRRLDGEGRVRLSDHRGRPLGLIFGSYT